MYEASRESPKPSHVTSVEETHEVIITKEDVVGFTEEETTGEQVEVEILITIAIWFQEKEFAKSTKLHSTNL